MLPEKTDEFRLIDHFRRLSPGREDVPLGIGDDTAVVNWSSPQGLLASDMLLEGVHFTMPPATPKQVGRKTLAVNLSDVAAMAGRPRFALVSLALPNDRASTIAPLLFAGMAKLAAEFDVAIVGGDTNSWDGPLVINIAITGDAPPGGAVRRSGAQPGDWLFVTGRLGGSITGHHLNFTPRVIEASILNETVQLHAMIDITDGLVADLYHILEESGVGAQLNAQSIPISGIPTQASDGRSPLEHALGDGEDFELLFSVTPEDGQRLIDDNPLDIPLTKIGTLTTASECVLTQSDGQTLPLPRLGWSHRCGATRQ